MGFPEQLKKARQSMNYTQQEVADLLGIAKSTYCGYEKGKRQPDVEKIKQLADILNTSSDILLETKKKIDGLNGFEAILANIYGSCTMESIMGSEHECLYFSLGVGKNKYALYEEDFDKLYDSIKKVTKSMTDLLVKTENEVRNSIIDEEFNRLTTAELEEEYKKSISSSAQKTSSTASNITNDTAKTGTNN